MATREQRDPIAESVLVRLGAELRASLRRKPAREAKLAGVLRALTAHSAVLRHELFAALEVMTRRGSFERPLYAAAVRALGECSERSLVPLLGGTLSAEGSGGLTTLCAACFVKDPALAEPLERAARSRQSVLAFAAEVARLARGESSGSQIAALAPKIKESHRIALCAELFVPLLSRPALPEQVGPAVGVLRDAERHLGRWLVLAEVASRAGDPRPLREAQRRAQTGLRSARSAWALVAWALEPPAARTLSVRPTLELVARLSDRPSAERDATFLFRLAAAKVESAKPMLETILRGSTLGDEARIRAGLHLQRDFGEETALRTLSASGRNPRNDSLRALLAAAHFDSGDKPAARALFGELERTRHLPALAWASLARVAEHDEHGEIVSEANFRRIQQGAVE